MAAVEAHYRTFHDDVQNCLTEGRSIYRALELTAQRWGVSPSTVRRAYYLTKNLPYECAPTIIQKVQQDATVIDLAEARKRQKVKRRRGSH